MMTKKPLMIFRFTCFLPELKTVLMEVLLSRSCESHSVHNGFIGCSKSACTYTSAHELCVLSKLLDRGRMYAEGPTP
jgi:hypothetical protein